ncbi:hypothetical protein K438DRAFT_1964888 [Mycena galopus ATCC 62051]|nr:hypothetical protein K438DRAFT_1964888 [Mycena galopus ATCC 62051]
MSDISKSLFWATAASLSGGQSPFNISSSVNLRTLYKAWKDGTCKWKVLSAKEKEKWRLEYQEKIESGEVVEKVRRGRSDKGEVRGANVRIMGKRAAAVKSKGRSKLMVEDSDEEDVDESEDKDKDEEGEDEKDSDEDLVPKKKNERGPKSAGSSKSKPTSEEEDSNGERVPKKKACSARSGASSKPKQTGEEEERDRECIPKKRACGANSGASSKPRQKRKLRDEEEDEPTSSKKVKRSGGEKRKRVEEEDDGEVESNPPVKKKKKKNDEPPKRKTAATKVKPAAHKPKEKAPPVADKPRPKPRAVFRGAPPPPACRSRDETQHTDDEVGADSEECRWRMSALKRNREAATDSVVVQDIADGKAAEAKAASERAGALALQADVSTEAQEAANQKAADAQASAEMAAKKVAALAALAAKMAAEVHGLHNSPPPSTSVPTSKRNTVKGKAGGPPGACFSKPRYPQ